MNKNVTLDIIQCLLNTFPKAAEWPTFNYCTGFVNEGSEFYSKRNENYIAYPIHLCCYNIHCNSDVIELLVGLFTTPLDKVCLIEGGIKCGNYGDCIEGWNEEQYQTVPLGYYLGRNSNISINVKTVRVLVEENSNALVTAGDDYKCYPVHIALSNSGGFVDSNKDDLHVIVTLCIEAEPSAVEMIDAHERTVLHVIFNENNDVNANLELVQYIVSKWPDTMQHVDIWGYFPLHYLCENGMDDSKLLALCCHCLGEGGGSK